jgi:hypothetical protein
MLQVVSRSSKHPFEQRLGISRALYIVRSVLCDHGLQCVDVGHQAAKFTKSPQQFFERFRAAAVTTR